MRRTILLVRALPAFALLVAQVALSSPARAAPGDLDPSFGTDGWVMTDLGDEGSYPFVSSLAIQSDGKIVVARSAFDRFLVVRYLQDGTLDSSFGEDGLVSTRFGGGRSSIWAVVLQPDGKIVTVGSACRRDECTRPRMAVARYLTDGNLDPEFGEGSGRVVVPSIRGVVVAAEVLPDGGILLAGSNWQSWRFGHTVELVRLSPNGTLDPTFGTDGIAITDLGRAWVRDFAFDEDGRTIALAEMGDAFKVARLGADGALDPAFGGDGIRRYALGEDTYSVQVALDAAGRLLVPVDVYDATSRNYLLGVARLLPDGRWDMSFSGDGVAYLPPAGLDDGLGNLTIQPDGKIVLCGGVLAGGGSGENDSLLARFTEDGTLDTTFGDQGVVEQPAPPGVEHTWGCDDVAMQDGRIVLVTSYYGYHPILMARFLGA